MKLKSMTPILTQFLKFGLVGLSNTLIALIVYYGVVAAGFHYQTGNIAAFIVSSASGFVLNKYWVFRASVNRTMLQVLKYYSVYLSSLGINMLISFLWVDLLDQDVYLAPLLSLSITIPYNYLLSRIWVYKEKIKNEKK